jgi:tetratricopeptide (TPR) repeat protein
MIKPQAPRVKNPSKRNGPRKRDAIVLMEPDPGESLGSVAVAADWRFHLASLTRISDNIVSRAVNAYDRIFGLDEREASEIYFDVGKKLVAEEKIDEAINALRKVLRAKPDHQQALFELGMLHLRRDAPVAAIAMLQRAKAAGLSDHKLHILLADALAEENKLDEALREFDLALALKPDLANTHYRRAVLLDRMERHADAVDAFEKAIRLSPRDIRYHQSLGFTLETMGQRTEAIRCFKRALEVERAKKQKRDEHDEHDEHDED